MPDSPAPTISTSTCSDVMVASRRIGLAIRLAVIATNYSAVGVKCNRQTKGPGSLRGPLESGMRLGWAVTTDHFSSRAPNATQHECCEPGPILLCMGLFSRFCVRASIRRQSHPALARDQAAQRV